MNTIIQQIEIQRTYIQQCSSYKKQNNNNLLASAYINQQQGKKKQNIFSNKKKLSQQIDKTNNYQKMMLVACSFCRQLLLEGYQHIYYEYAACLRCYEVINQNWKVADFVRVSLLKQKGNQKLQKLIKINKELGEFLILRSITLQHPFFLQAIDQFFSRINNSISKSHLSDTSTSPSQDIITKQQHPKLFSINKQTLLQSLFQKTKIEDKKNLIRLMEIKDKIAETGSNLIEKIKENEKVQRQVENLNVYKCRLIESGIGVKKKFNKIKQQVKDISAELPSIKQTLKGIGLNKFGFLKKW